MQDAHVQSARAHVRTRGEDENVWSAATESLDLLRVIVYSICQWQLIRQGEE